MSGPAECQSVHEEALDAAAAQRLDDAAAAGEIGDRRGVQGVRRADQRRAPHSPQEKSRSAMVPSSRRTRCGVVHAGRGSRRVRIRPAGLPAKPQKPHRRSPPSMPATRTGLPKTPAPAPFAELLLLVHGRFETSCRFDGSCLNEINPRCATMPQSRRSNQPRMTAGPYRRRLRVQTLPSRATQLSPIFT